jgi:hypothetical protein
MLRTAFQNRPAEKLLLRFAWFACFPVGQAARIGRQFPDLRRNFLSENPE